MLIALTTVLPIVSTEVLAQQHMRGISESGFFGPIRGRETGLRSIDAAYGLANPSQCAARCRARSDCTGFGWGTGGNYRGNCYLIGGGWPGRWENMVPNPDVAHYYRFPLVSPQPMRSGSGRPAEEQYQMALRAGGCDAVRQETYSFPGWYWNSFLESRQYAEIVDPQVLQTVEPVEYPRRIMQPTEIDLSVDRFIRLMNRFAHCFPGF